MRETVYKNIFKKQYKLMKKRGKNEKEIKEIILLLAQDLPIPPSHKDHPLKGELLGFRELHIEPNWLLVYQKEAPSDQYPEGALYLELTGTHSDLFE